jgi:hypothetical protein
MKSVAGINERLTMYFVVFSALTLPIWAEIATNIRALIPIETCPPERIQDCLFRLCR